MQTENETPFVNDDIVVDSINNTTNKPNRNHEVICVLMSAMIFLLSFSLNIIAIASGELTEFIVIYDQPSDLPPNYVDCNNHYIGTTTSQNPVDYYIFVITPNNNNGTVSFDICNSSYNAQLNFYDSNWSSITKCNGCNHCVAPIYLGQYYVKISNNISQYGTYKLQITCTHEHITPSPTEHVPDTPPKALLFCGYNGIKEFYGRDYFFCGDYDKFCDEWSILCSMKSVVRMWLILGICSIIIGAVAIVMMFYGWCIRNRKGVISVSNHTKCSKISATILMIIYLIICVSNMIVYKKNSTCYDEYCSKVSALWDAEYYKCDFQSARDGSFFYLYVGVGIVAILLYIFGEKMANVLKLEKYQNKYKKYNRDMKEEEEGL